MIGNFTPAGRQWRPVGQPVETNTHDFPDEELGKAVPYGVYDVAGDTGWVSVGGSSDPNPRVGDELISVSCG